MNNCNVHEHKIRWTCEEYKKLILLEVQNKGCQNPQWCKCARSYTPQQHTLCTVSTGAQFTLFLKQLSKESSGLSIM